VPGFGSKRLEKFKQEEHVEINNKDWEDSSQPSISYLKKTKTEIFDLLVCFFCKAVN